MQPPPTCFWLPHSCYVNHRGEGEITETNQPQYSKGKETLTWDKAVRTLCGKDKEKATQSAAQQRERGLLPHRLQTYSTTPKRPGNQLIILFPLGQLFLEIAVHVPVGLAGGQDGEPWAERGGGGCYCGAKMENKQHFWMMGKHPCFQQTSKAQQTHRALQDGGEGERNRFCLA